MIREGCSRAGHAEGRGGGTRGLPPHGARGPVEVAQQVEDRAGDPAPREQPQRHPPALVVAIDRLDQADVALVDQVLQHHRAGQAGVDPPRDGVDQGQVRDDQRVSLARIELRRDRPVRREQRHQLHVLPPLRALGALRRRPLAALLNAPPHHHRLRGHRLSSPGPACDHRDRMLTSYQDRIIRVMSQN